MAEQMAEEAWTKFNPLIGFRCLHYSVSEAIGVVKIKVINKTGDEMTFGVRTVDGTALQGEDFDAIDEKIKFEADQVEATVEVNIINDDVYEDNEDFWVELYDPETGEKLVGDDTKTQITVIDDD
jgi:hypothetical protein